ncbi:MAG: primosomal protein N' [Alphaproteobacteria bacterium]
MPARRASSAPAAAPPEARARARVRVLLPLPLEGPYDYRRASGEALAAGDIVLVPLGGRELAGCVWDEADEGVEEVAAARLRDVRRRLPAPPLPEALRRFVNWVAGYTLSAPGAVLKMVLSVPDALEAERPITAYAAAEDAAAKGRAVRMTAARSRVMAALAAGPPRAASELAREAGVSPGVVAGLARAGLLQAVTVAPPLPFARPDWRRPAPRFSPDQAAAAADLAAKARDGGFSVTLLDGVTGAGKTEVYLDAVAAALRAGRQVLVLVPEIALTAQWLGRFEARFGAVPVEWHSDLTPAQRRLAWRAVAEGKARVVVGARSALFLPFPELGLVVVDEEHDASFKQEDGVVYHARDMAVVRARIEGIPIVLVTATPSLETVTNVAAGRYQCLRLPERHGGARLPDIHVVDMRADPPPRQHWLSPALRAALGETFEAGEQAMLFLNRRGYAPLTLCRRCGHRLDCPNCTAWLVQHRSRGRLLCHHCGLTTALPEACPRCGEADSFAACGPGVERLGEEVSALFPDARYGIMTSDTLTGPKAAAGFVRRVERRELDLVIGTQMVAKGHHFPLLTLVGVIDADLGLAGGDLRAAERTYQLLAQVSGRAGRAQRPGRVFVQTYMPEHPVMGALVSGDRDRFLEAEAAARRAQGMPPFGRLAAVIVSGPKEGAVIAAARALGRGAPRAPGIEVLGPAPAPLARVGGRYRWRLLVKARKTLDIQTPLRRWLGPVTAKGGVRIKVDIDPYSFL